MRPCRCGRSAPAGQGRAQAISPLSPSTITFATSSSDPPTMATRRGRGQLPRGRGQLLVTVPDCEGPGTVTSNCPRLCFPRPPPFPHPRPHPFRPGPRLAEPAPGHDQPDAPRPRAGIAGPRLDLPPMCLPPPFLLDRANDGLRQPAQHPRALVGGQARQRVKDRPRPAARDDWGAWGGSPGAEFGGSRLCRVQPRRISAIGEHGQRAERSVRATIVATIALGTCDNSNC